MSIEKINTTDASVATVTRGAGSSESVDMHGTYTATCIDKNGNVKWSENFENTVTTVGKNDLLDKYLAGSAYTAAWYIGLLGGTGTISAADTMSSHAGWTEVGGSNAPAYSQSTRPAPSWSAASSGSKAASAAVSFSITSSGTVKGAFLNSVATKDGTTGTLYSAGLFSVGDKAVTNGDTLNVTYTASA